MRVAVRDPFELFELFFAIQMLFLSFFEHERSVIQAFIEVLLTAIFPLLNSALLLSNNVI